MIKIKPNYLDYFLRSLPNMFWPLKWFLIRSSLKKVGKKFHFGYDSKFLDHRLIEVGDNVFMGLGTLISVNVTVIIGNNVMFGPRVTIIGGNHNFNKVGIPMRYVKTGGENIPIIIENDVWIGANVTILKGVTIAEGCVVGAGSVVTKSMPPYSICIGNPCKPYKLRFSETDLNDHLSSVNSNYTSSKVLESFSLFKK